MGPVISLVISYRDKGCPHRSAAFDYTLAYYQGFIDEIIVEGQGARPEALNLAIGRASGDVIVQADADSLVNPGMLGFAVVWATEPGLIVPFERYLYLTPLATERVLAGADPFTMGPDDCIVSGHGGVGNVTVFSRETWERSGRYDERFRTWGGDDAAFAYAAEAFCAPTRRLEGDMVHLWHPAPPESIPGCLAYADQFTIVAEYRDAAVQGPAAVRQYVRNR